MKESLESAASAWDAWERFMGRVGLAGVVAFGVLVLMGLGELGDGIPRHREIGAAIVGVGGLFLVATFARGTFGAFAKNLSLSIAIGGLAAGCGYVVWREVRIADALVNEGVPRTLRVEASTMDHAKGGGFRVRLVGDGGPWTIQRDRSPGVGSSLTLLTHADRRDWYAEAGEGAGHLEIIEARGWRTPVIVSGVAALLLGLWALSLLFAALTGRRAPDGDE